MQNYLAEKLVRLLIESDRGRKGCAMAELTPSDAIPFLEYVESIPDEDINEEEGGKEDSMHVTVLYGLLDKDPEAIIDACRSFGVITATLGLVESFDNDEFDVLKVTVISDDLKRLNAKLRELPYENDYPDYKAHLTLAYLKKGLAKEYVGNDVFKDFPITFDRIVYSDADKKRTEISLM